MLHTTAALHRVLVRRAEKACCLAALVTGTLGCGLDVHLGAATDGGSDGGNATPDASGSGGWVLQASDFWLHERNAYAAPWAVGGAPLGAAATATGGYLLASTFTEVANLGGSDLVASGETDAFISSKTDAFLVRYSRLSDLGAHEWSFATRTGPSGSAESHGLAVDSSDNVYVVGLFEGTVGFDPGSASANLTSAGGTDVFLASYTSAGRYRWVQRFGGTGNDRGLDVAIDATGRVCFAGSFEGTVDFGGGALSSASGSNAIVACYDATNGSFLSDLSALNSASVVASRLALDSSTGDVYAVGTFEGTVNFGTGYLTSAGATDAWISKLGATGAPQWSARYGGVGSERAPSVAVHDATAVYIAGSFEQTVNFGGGPVTASGLDIYLLALGPAGEFRWLRTISSPGRDWGGAVATDADSNVHLAGALGGNVHLGGASIGAPQSVLTVGYSSLGEYLGAADWPTPVCPVPNPEPALCPDPRPKRILAADDGILGVFGSFTGTSGLFRLVYAR